MPDLTLVTRAALWLQYFRSLCGQGIDFETAMDMADDRFGFTRPEGSLSERLRNGSDRAG